MLTRRLPRFPALLNALGLIGFTTVLGFASGCVTINSDDSGDGDSGNSDESGDGDGNNDSNNDDGNNDDGNNDDGNNDDGSEICQDACDVLASCGFPTDQCLSFCFDGPCGECLADSDQCGQDCANACAGDGDGDDDPTTGDGDGDGDVPPKECVINDDCGLSFECVSCNLTDSEGWCEQSQDCSFDEDCGFGRKCGYNVESGDWRCLPAEYCE